MQILILYYTKTGHTLEAAEAIADGLASAGNKVQLTEAKNFDPEKMNKYDMLIAGSPCWGGSMGAGISAPVKKALNRLSSEVKGKPCAGFSVYGGAGGRNTVAAIGSILKKKGCSLYIEGPAVKAGTPLSLWKGPAVREKDLSFCREFGMKLVKQMTGK